MATRKQLCAIVARNLPLRGFVSEDSEAIARATDIIVGVSEDLVSEAAKVRAGLKEQGTARATFEVKYLSALREARQWEETSRGEDFTVARALVEHLEKTGESYGLQREYRSR